MNRSQVGQTFLSAGRGDVPVAHRAGLESPAHRQAREPALPGSWPLRMAARPTELPGSHPPTGLKATANHQPLPSETPSPELGAPPPLPDWVGMPLPSGMPSPELGAGPRVTANTINVTTTAIIAFMIMPSLLLGCSWLLGAPRRWPDRFAAKPVPHGSSGTPASEGGRRVAPVSEPESLWNRRQQHVIGVPASSG